MQTFKHLIIHIKKYGNSHQPLYALFFMILFWAIFDAILAYVAPLIITDAGLSKTMMGLILGSSSIAGAIFDIIACKIFKNVSFRRMFLVMFAICFIYPLILFSAKQIPLHAAVEMW